MNTGLLDPAVQDELSRCLHCGMCLQVCPTYHIYGTEMDSPRGRIALMRAVTKGRLKVSELPSSFIRHIELCLACRACESACPSGMEYGHLIEAAQSTIRQNVKDSRVARWLKWVGFRQLMPFRERLKVLASILWLYENSGLQTVFRSLHFLPQRLKSMEFLLPPISREYFNYAFPAPAIGQKRGKVAFFIGCVQEAFLAKANRATIRVLQRNGYEVHFPAGQTCCGAAQLHQGDLEFARTLARKNIDAFLDNGFEAVISNAGGCGATLKDEYTELFKEDPIYSERASRFSSLVRDFSEFMLDHLHEPPRGAVPVRAVYSDSCHLRHVQKISRQPRQLLRLIPGLDLVELKRPDLCCGSAGVYNIMHPQTANPILDLKMDDVKSTKADLLIVSNTGCHMQLIAGTERSNLPIRVAYIAEVLEESYTQGSPG
ncbi:MAG: (Fe-S)-binding protein [Deltaproteobacteria bacterium]|nr:(Fe-S)-binding protein [Deltaproteobacteria bacterium]